MSLWNALRHLEKALGTVELLIKALVDQTAELAERVRRLDAIPGVGLLTAVLRKLLVLMNRLLKNPDFSLV